MDHRRESIYRIEKNKRKEELTVKWTKGKTESHRKRKVKVRVI